MKRMPQEIKRQNTAGSVPGLFCGQNEQVKKPCLMLAKDFRPLSPKPPGVDGAPLPQRIVHILHDRVCQCSAISAGQPLLQLIAIRQGQRLICRSRGDLPLRGQNGKLTCIEPAFFHLDCISHNSSRFQGPCGFKAAWINGYHHYATSSVEKQPRRRPEGTAKTNYGSSRRKRWLDCPPCVIEVPPCLWASIGNGFLYQWLYFGLSYGIMVKEH